MLRSVFRNQSHSKPFIDTFLALSSSQYHDVLATFLVDGFQVPMFCAGIVKNEKVVFTPIIFINLSQ